MLHFKLPLLGFVLCSLSCSAVALETLSSPSASQNQTMTSQVQKVRWLNPPTFSYKHKELKGKHRTIELDIDVRADGSIQHIRIQKSSGIAKLDKKLLTQVLNTGRFHKTGYAFTVTQPFHLDLPDSVLAPNAWTIPPEILYQQIDLQGQNRQLVIELSRDEKGSIRQLRVLQSSGLPDLDEKIIAGFQHARLDPKLTPPIFSYPMLLNQIYALNESRKIKIRSGMPNQEADKIWRYFPVLNYKNADLEGQTRNLTLRMHFNAQGKIQQIELLSSTGRSHLDAKIMEQVRAAQLYSHHAPIVLDIPLELRAK